MSFFFLLNQKYVTFFALPGTGIETLTVKEVDPLKQFVYIVGNRKDRINEINFVFVNEIRSGLFTNRTLNNVI